MNECLARAFSWISPGQQGLMIYQLYEINHAALQPARAMADTVRLLYTNPLNPWSHTALGRTMAAGAELFERSTRRYGKPEFGIDSTVVEGRTVPVVEEIVWARPFCNLVHFERDLPAGTKAGPKLLIVAPMSGHYATLLRGTVQAMLPHADVYITDWVDARMVPVADGRFDLDDYIDYIIRMFHHLGPGTHVMGVCQPSVPVLAAVALMEAAGDPFSPATMTLMGGPVDTRAAPTQVTRFAESRPLAWFEHSVIAQVPAYYPGGGRRVYPGFLQIGSFISMNPARHFDSHLQMFRHLVQGDGESAEAHRRFYDEYLAVMDVPAAYYLETVDQIFQRHLLPRGEMQWRGCSIRPEVIKKTALMTIEGELDDISAPGQTLAAQELCSSLPEQMRDNYLQVGVGHYGIFNGRRWRNQIKPRIAAFVRRHQTPPS